jgi:putative transposase
VGKNPTDRGKKGTKRSLLVDDQGGPLGLVIDGANRHAPKLLRATIEAIVVAGPEPTPQQPQHLCLDQAYDNPTGHATVAATGYTPHIRQIGEEKAAASQRRRQKPRRRVVERTLAWLSKCRAILVRYDKHAFNYLGLVQWACGLFWYRRLHRWGAGINVLR